MKYLAIVTSLTFFALACSAQAQSISLKPYVASYLISYDDIPFGQSDNSFLIKNHHYRFCINNVSTIPFIQGKETECSEGKIYHHTVQPEYYTFHYEHNHKEQNIHITFDWSKHIATTKTNHNQWQMPIKNGTQDRISAILQLRKDIMNQSYFSFPVADGGKIKTYQYKIMGKEIVTTPLHPFDTIEVTRMPLAHKKNLTLWIAPQLDYMVVRIEQKKNIIDNGTASLETYNA